MWKMSDDMNKCMSCPRKCEVDRENGKTGVCGVPADIYVARAALHYWEEPCISGSEEAGNRNGSGTVFFSGCVLKCVYCQNYEVAHATVGKRITVERLAEIFFELQEKGALNINIVTPTQYIPQIAEAIEIARSRGISIPFVCNCGGYENPGMLKHLEGLVDIYLTDFKYMDAEAAGKYSRASDYPEWAKASLAEMVRQQPEAVFSEDGLMKKGVIVRHLVLPGMVRNAKEVIHYVYRTYGDRVWLSLMNQYTPFERVKELYPEIGRKVTRREYNEVLDYAISLGVENAYIQEGSTAKESFIPVFDGEGVTKG
jgi:putative pyruvate formate lyase activating enzyme